MSDQTAAGAPTPAPAPNLAALPLFADPAPADPPAADIHPPAVAVNGSGSSARRALPDGPWGGGGLRRHSNGATVPAPAAPARSGRTGPTARETSAGIDWSLVRAFRQQAAEQLSARLQDRDGLDATEQHELGRSIVLDMLSDHANEAMHTGTPTFTPDEQEQLAAAIFNSLFGLGRLQPLVDNPDVENIEIYGHDNVLLEFSDGRLEEGPPVADSDAELIEALAFLGSRSQTNERPFSPATADLHLRLDGGARLAATAWVTPRPAAVIRRHRLRVVTLDDLVDRGMFDAGMATFLAAAVHAKKSLVISGAQGAGKTTLIRALCSELDPWERIGTVETEYELHLHELTERHKRIVPWEARPGSGERGPDGRAAGEITLDDFLYASMRFNLSRVIVGEVRGKEVLAMFKAMQTGAGSMSTTHAHSARAAVERLVTCAMEAGPHVTEQFAYRQVSEHINLIVQVALESTPGAAGAPPQRHRYITEVIHIEAGEHGRPAITDVYRPGEDGRAVPGTLPQPLMGLTRFGFDSAGFTGRAA